MQTQAPQFERVLAIDPTDPGFAFVVLEGGYRLVDWGVARLWSKNGHEFLNRLEVLVDRYNPIAIVTEDRSNWRKESWPVKRWRMIEPYAGIRHLEYVAMSRDQVRWAFGGPRKTRHAIATILLDEFPELAPYLPPRPNAWSDERQAMNIFDALSFLITARLATKKRHPQ
jgi:hypothetical protein